MRFTCNLYYTANFISDFSTHIHLTVYYVLVDGINVTRKRGYTRNIALSREKKAGKKVKVQVSEVSERVIGEGAQQYISEASCVIRKYGNWKAEKWSKLQESDREGMLKLVNVSEIGLKACFSS